MASIAGMGELGTVYLISFAITVGMQLGCFFIAYALSIDKITDLAGCANFIAIALWSLLIGRPPLDTRRIVLNSLVCASRFQLGSYLLYRVLKRGRDSRFDEVRERCGVFLFFWVWQMLWVFVTSASLLYINAVGHRADPELSAADVAAWALFGVGWLLQVSSDLIKLFFRANPANKMRVCDVGPWRYSRHPNFCGEVLMWWGVFVGGIPVYLVSAGGWSTVASPLFTMGILLLFTGIPQAEGSASKRWYDGGEAQQRFEAYFRSTPPLWLCPPALYSRLPLGLKRLLCFELPFYEYKELEEMPDDLSGSLTQDQQMPAGAGAGAVMPSQS